MKKENIWNIILSAVLVLMTVACGLTVAVVVRLDMLPTKYILILAGIFALLLLATGLLMFLHRRGKKVGTARRIIACVLAALIVGGCAALCVVATDIYEAMQNITTPPDSTTTRGLYVRMEDPAQALEDAAQYKFAAVENYDTDGTEQVLEYLRYTLGKEPDVTYFATVTAMIDALYSGDVGVMILNGATIEILVEELDVYTDFSHKVRLLYDVPIQEWTPPEDPTESTGSTEATGSTEQTEGTTPTIPSDDVYEGIATKPFVVYIGGSDSRSSKLYKNTRYDVNILAVVNPMTKQVLLINTPRDYYVENPAGKGAKDKLTHCGNFGVNCSIQALEGLYGIDVDYYARINFEGFKKLIDAIGGVPFYSDKNFTTSSGYVIKQGLNQLDGKMALAVARERYSHSNGDHERGKNQMKIIKAAINKLTSGTTVISNYSQILSSLSGMFDTNMSMEDISNLVKMQLGDLALWNVQTYAVTGRGGYAETYSMPGWQLSVIHPNETKVAYATELAKRVLDGKIITEKDVTAK